MDYGKLYDEHVANTEPFGRSCETASALEELNPQRANASATASARAEPRLRGILPPRLPPSPPALAGRQARPVRSEAVSIVPLLVVLGVLPWHSMTIESPESEAPLQTVAPGA